MGAAGGMHLWLYFDYFHRVHPVGTLFIINAALGLFDAWGGAVTAEESDRRPVAYNPSAMPAGESVVAEPAQPRPRSPPA